MIVEMHSYKDRIVIDLEKNEFLLIAYLIEKSVKKNKSVRPDFWEENLDRTIHKEMQQYIDDELS